jgi:hypothetical protein
LPFVLFIIIIHLFTCTYIVWVISPSCTPPPSPSFLGRTYSAFFSILLKSRNKQ